MPAFAARVGDVTTHGGFCVGPGCSNVLIGGMPAAVLGDMHTCAIPPPAHAPTASPFAFGSGSVMFCGRPALRVGDVCGCGAFVAIGCATVVIGG
jgi:uncharacterized Zn-binding protein involved in type VI secretion